MKIINSEKLFSDFRKHFDICRYTDAAFADEIKKRLKEDNITSGTFLFRFRLIIFKFEVAAESIEYIGYEK